MHYGQGTKSELQYGLYLILDDIFLSLFVRSSESLSSRNRVTLRHESLGRSLAAHRGGPVGILEAVLALNRASMNLRFIGNASMTRDRKKWEGEISNSGY